MHKLGVVVAVAFGVLSGTAHAAPSPPRRFLPASAPPSAPPSSPPPPAAAAGVATVRMASGSGAEGQDVAWVEQTVPLADVTRMLRPGTVLPLPGMQVETRLNTLPVLLGGLWFASGLVLGVVDAANTSYAPAAIPFVGPVLSLMRGPANDPTSGDGSSSGSVSTMPILAGLSQLGGAAVLVVGLLTPRRFAIFDAPQGAPLAARRATAPRWALLPAAPGAAVGASFSLVNF